MKGIESSRAHLFGGIPSVFPTLYLKNPRLLIGHFFTSTLQMGQLHHRQLYEEHYLLKPGHFNESTQSYRFITLQNRIHKLVDRLL